MILMEQFFSKEIWSRFSVRKWDTSMAAMIEEFRPLKRWKLCLNIEMKYYVQLVFFWIIRFLMQNSKQMVSSLLMFYKFKLFNWKLDEKEQKVF